MKKISTMLVVLSLSVLTFVICNVKEVHGAEMPYSVKAVIPDNQIDKGKTYFDLKMTKGTTQTLTLELTNEESHDITLNVTPQNGTTNSNGVIDYSGHGELLDGALKFTTLTSGKQTVKLKSKEQKKISFDVTMPKEDFDGHVIGAFQIQQLESEVTDQSSSEEGITLQNRFAYVVGVSLEETDVTLTPELKLGEITVKSNNAFYSLRVPLLLPTRDYIKNAQYEAQVFKKGSAQALLSFKRDNFSMAPESIYENFEQVDPDVLGAGTYVLKMTITGGEKAQLLEKEFTITRAAEKAALANTLNEKPFDWQIVIIGGIALLILLVLIMILILLKRRKRKEEDA